jgi:hypothetical protein
MTPPDQPDNVVDPPTPAPAVNVKAIASELLHVGARIDAFKARQAELRAQLETVAVARWEEEGAAPSWKVPRLGTVSLIGCDPDPQVNVTNDDAYVEWLLANHPTEVNVVITIPGTITNETTDAILATMLSIGCRVDYETSAPFFAKLVKEGRADADAGELWEAETGQIIPGVTVTQEPNPSLRVTLLAEAKARARAVIDNVLAEPGSPNDPDALPAPDDDVDTNGDAPPPDDEGPDHTSTIELGDPEDTRDEVPGPAGLEADPVTRELP